MTILTAPEDRSFPNGPVYAKGDPVDVGALAAALGRTDVDVLAADLIDQGWPVRPAKKTGAAKKAPGKTDPAPAGDDNPPTGDNQKETP